MPVLVDAQPISINPGTREFEHAIDNPGILVVRLARQTTATPTLWPASVEIAVRVDTSSDGGATWRGLAGFTAVGGIVPNRGGEGEAAETVMQCPFPSAANRVRLRITVAGGRFDSLLTVERV